MKQKSKVFEKLKAFKVFIENQTENKIKKIRSDNGGEFIVSTLNDFCNETGIQHQLTTSHTPQQNGRAERMNRTLREKAKCLLFHAELPKNYWTEAKNMAAYTINHSINAVIQDKTPDELFYERKST